MLHRRALAGLMIATVCALCAQLGVPAVAGTPDGQVISGARVAAMADRIARSLVSGPDRSVAPAYTVADQNLPAGAVQLAPAGSPFVSATYVGVPVAIRIDGKLARTVVAGYRVTSYVHTVKAGQAAILVVRDGPVALTVDVVARTGGAVGDTVTVFNPQTQKAIAAVVTGPNRVELTLPGGER